MNNDTIDLKKFQREAKIREMKQKALYKAKSFVEWCQDNKEGLAIAGVIAAGAGKVGKMALKHHDLKVEQRLKDRNVYDHSTGSYVELKHKLKGRDIEQIQSIRRTTGCSYTEALMKLNLVKR